MTENMLPLKEFNFGNLKWMKTKKTGSSKNQNSSTERIQFEIEWCFRWKVKRTKLEFRK